mmetsp:Transcript_17136/g.39842  ORF Transcript_17136/g.39842 Transcript_17136/m.39842 type:complete len:604 (-) Transcript_17136:196-2007(-)
MRAAARRLLLLAAAALPASRCLSLPPTRQTLVLDGAELAYYAGRLLARPGGPDPVPDVTPRARRKRDRAGTVRLAAASPDGELRLDGGRVLGTADRVIGLVAEAGPGDGTVSVGGAELRRDSLAVLPPSLSDADAVSTASACLLGVHCAVDTNSTNNRVVVAGGGDRAAFLAAAHASLGREAFLVTSRPRWSLPRSLPRSVEVVPPSVGTMGLPFASYVGRFDALVDTLGDEIGLGRSADAKDGFDALIQNGPFIARLREEHGCESYVSTVTRSQQIVSRRGVLRARGAVARYQEECESNAGLFRTLPPPDSFGATLQRLLDGGVVCRSGANEAGPHAEKEALVRGWSLGDSAEAKTWPRAGSARYGFPEVDISIGKSPVKAAPATDPAASADAATAPRRPQRPKVRVVSPHVTPIGSVADLERLIVGPKRRCVLLVTSGSCRRCHRLRPQFNRIARAHAEGSDGEKEEDGVVFAQADTSGPRGRQLARVLDADRVPSVVVFRDGRRVPTGAGASSSVVVGRRSLERLPRLAGALAGPTASRIDVEALLSGTAPSGERAFRRCGRADELRCGCVGRCALVVSDAFSRCRLDCSCTDRCVLGVV